jgi:hypothetical protein
MRVAGHAVRRYMERIEPLEFEAARQRIRAMAPEAVPFKNCDGLWHAATGLVLIAEDGKIITVLSPEQSQKYRGRRLINGTTAGEVLWPSQRLRTSGSLPDEAARPDGVVNTLPSRWGAALRKGAGNVVRCLSALRGEASTGAQRR